MANAFKEYNWREIAINSCIKGYHIFKIRPCEDVVMEVSREENNEYDEHAMLVKMPDIVADNLLQKVTRAESSRYPIQRVRDILGKTVGRVPANLCRAFPEMEQKNFTVGSIQCAYGGNAQQARNVPVHQAFSRSRTR